MASLINSTDDMTIEGLSYTELDVHMKF